MKEEITGAYCFFNHRPCSPEDRGIFDCMDKSSIYEVIKIIDGIPLFFEAHMDRFHRSAQLSGRPIQKKTSEILEEIYTLTEKNRQEHINVKLVCTRQKGKEVFLTYFIRSDYPGADVYAKGIRTVLYSGERECPNIKTLKDSFKARVHTALEQVGAYEALLTDPQGFISEGSRSNIFFLKKEEIFTPPAGTVLMGVTRKHVTEICKNTGLNLSERTLHISELPEIDGAFITGTTVDVLPVSQVDEISLSSVSHPVIRRIIELFGKEIREYVRKRKIQS